MTTFLLEDEIRSALSDEVDPITPLPDLATLTARIDRQTRMAPARRFAAGAALALALVSGVAGASALAGGGDGDRTQSVSVAHAPKHKAVKPDYKPDFSKDVKADWDEPKPEPPKPEAPKPEPTPEQKPAPVAVAPKQQPKPVEPKPATTTTAKPAPVPTTTIVKPAPEGDTTPPAIRVISPENGTTVDTNRVTFVGETEPGAKVYVDGIWVEPDPATGRWQVTLDVSPGTNVKKFKAMDAAGNRTYVEVTIHCTAQQGAFTANQTYGSSAENPPFDVFYGTAAPGALVKVASSYGYAETVADANGNYEIKVTFADAPVGKTFDVKVRSGDAYKYFTFTRTA